MDNCVEERAEDVEVGFFIEKDDGLKGKKERKRGPRYGVQSVEENIRAVVLPGEWMPTSFYSMIVSGLVNASLSHAASKVRWYRACCSEF